MREQARNRFKPVLAPFPGGNYPLDLVQIDHTEADIIVVDEKNRLPICRPWLTLAIDVYSRMVVGLYVTLEKPSTTSVGLCLSMAMLPKAAYLTQLGVTGEWPVWGRMRIVHADNGKEFRGNTLKRACENYGIELNWRPVRVPHYGGHIERLMGTTASLIHTLPGTTFSNPVERKGYDSEKKAALTLAEFESLLVDLIVNVYHRRIHDELKTTPMSCWEMGIEGDGDTPGRGLPDIPVDRERLIIDFLPFEERTVQPYGVQWDDLHYLHEGMLRWINSIDPSNAKLKRKFLVRRDPRDISRIYFFDPELNDYLTAPTRGMALPPTPLWEYREARKALIESGKKSFNEHEVAEAIARIRRKAQVATDTTKGTRRAAARLKHALKAKATAPVPPEASPRVSAKPPVKPAPASVDLFSRPLQPFSIDID